MTTLRDWTTGNLVGLGVLGLAVAWMVASGIRAARLDPLPEGAAEEARRAPYPVSASAPLPPTPAILAAVRANPMRPDRRRSDGRYGQEPVAEDAEPELRDPVPAFRVVGIVRRRTGPDLAAIAADRISARLVRRGGQIQGFVLSRVRADSVFLARPDTAIGLAVPGRRYGGGSD